MIARDDGYNPTNTVKVTKQLVLQDKIFAMLGGLGTPTHTKVVDYLNASRVPDLFVASGCCAGTSPRSTRRPSAGSPTTPSRARSSASRSRRTTRARRSPTSSRTTTSAPMAPRAWTSTSRRTRSSRARPTSRATPTSGRRWPRSRPGRRGRRHVHIPAYTALVRLAGLKLDYHPQLVVCNVGSDPTTLKGLLKAFSKGKTQERADRGDHTDAYLPPGATRQRLDRAVQKIHDQYIPSCPSTATWSTGWGWRTRSSRRCSGPARTRPASASSRRSRAGELTGPGLVPFRYSKDSHAGYTGAQIGRDQGRRDRRDGQPLVTDDGDGDITEFDKNPASAPARRSGRRLTATTTGGVTPRRRGPAG